MQEDKFIWRCLKSMYPFLLILCAVLSASAQSGRRLPKPTPTPPVVTELKTSAEKNEPSVKIEHLLIVGEIQDNDSYSETTKLNWTLDYCLTELERQPNLSLKAQVGGKMNFKEAQNIAKKGKNVYVLWIGFVLENIGNGKTQVNYANFTILKPESAKKLFTGRIDPKMVAKNGGVMGIPSGSKQSISEASQMGNVGREIIYRMLRWGWLSD
jgi:hypothetical protein